MNRQGARAKAMVKSTPVTTYHAIPIYLRPLKKKREMWLQWKYEGIQYGVRVSNMGQSLYNAKQMIDAMLELEAKSYEAMSC